MKERSHPLWKNKLVFLGLLGIVSLSFVIPAATSTVGSTVLFPIHMTKLWFIESSHALPVYLRNKDELLSKIDELERQITEMSVTQASRNRLHKENQQLRSMLELPVEQTRLLGRVIARPTQLPYDVLQIDIGARDGVVTGAPVYLGHDQVLGFISFTAARYALVTLVTSPEQLGTAYVFGPNIYARTEGVGGGVLRIRIPQGVPVDEGDLAILPAVDIGQFGIITHIETRPTEPQQYAYVSLPVSLQSIRYVSVGTAPIEQVSFREVVERVEAASTTMFAVDVIDDQFDVATSSETESFELPAIEEQSNINDG